MAVINLMEDIVGHVLSKEWCNLGMTCSCQICKDDVLAISLNNLPTRYVTNHRGQVIVRARFQDEQYQADVYREITKAALIVSAKPSHP